jgi:hypothetical protein
MYWLIVAVVVLNVVIFALRTRSRMRGMQTGDFIKVSIPRTADGPLAMGTRLDIAAALIKAGTPRAELRPLIESHDDQALLDRYWAMIDAGSKD